LAAIELLESTIAVKIVVVVVVVVGVVVGDAVVANENDVPVMVSSDVGAAEITGDKFALGTELGDGVGDGVGDGLGDGVGDGLGDGVGRGVCCGVGGVGAAVAGEQMSVVHVQDCEAVSQFCNATPVSNLKSNRGQRLTKQLVSEVCCNTLQQQCQCQFSSRTKQLRTKSQLQTELKDSEALLRGDCVEGS
jgi:hypothetical protein